MSRMCILCCGGAYQLVLVSHRLFDLNIHMGHLDILLLLSYYTQRTTLGVVISYMYVIIYVSDSSTNWVSSLTLWLLKGLGQIQGDTSINAFH